MEQIVVFGMEQLGDAIVRYIGMKQANSKFFPYHIKESDWKPELPIRISLQLNPEKQTLYTEPLPGTQNPQGGDVETQLTHDEIVEAIWLMLPLETMRSFIKPGLSDISIKIPEKVTFKLSGIPRGGLSVDYQHALL